MKILIINPFGIGDVIFSTPLIEALKDIYPDSFIGYVCNKRAHEAIVSNPNINKIFIYEKDDYRSVWRRSKIECLKKIINFLRGIREERFDITIDLSLGYQYSLFLKIIGIKKRIGFNYRNRGHFLTDKINIEGFNNKHVIEYYLDMLKLLGKEPDRYRIGPKIYFGEDDITWARNFLKDNGVDEKSMVIGIIPGCGASWGVDAKYRRWEKEKFSRVADLLAEKHGAKILLFGDSRDTAICQEIKRLAKNRVIDACGKTSIGEFLGLASRCRLIITNDGGPLHMAVGAGVATVSLFGPVNERIYGPYPASPRHITVAVDMPCRPCYKNFKYIKCEMRRCLADIKTEDVLNAAEKLLKD